jgi:predicted Zn-dependent protease
MKKLSRAELRSFIAESTARDLQEVGALVASPLAASGPVGMVVLVALADYLITGKTPSDRVEEVMQLHDELKKNSEVYSSLMDLARAIRELPFRAAGKAGEALKAGLIAAIEEAIEGLDSIAADEPTTDEKRAMHDALGMPS